jgi:4a-hydroxytetrahydrobiopterin dehydratase
MKIIDKADLNQWLDSHELWAYEDGQIIFETQFDNFIDAFGFLSKVAIVAEKHNHHPTIINSYGNVHLSMNTHDAGNKITDRDLNLAEAIEELL